MPELTSLVLFSNWIIPTICKHIVTDEILPGGGVRIRVDKAANLGVVIAGLQVIEATFGVVVITTVTQGVDTYQRAGCGEDFAVGIVDVGCNNSSGGVNQVEHVTLGVGDVVILGAVVGQGEGVSVGIVGKIKGIVSISLPEQLSASVVVGMEGAVDSLACPQTVHSVGVRNGRTAVVCRRQPTAALPGEVPACAVVIAQGVANGIIGDGMSIVRRQQVWPRSVAVGVSVPICRQEIARGIVGVRIGDAAAAGRNELPLNVIPVSPRATYLSRTRNNQSRYNPRRTDIPQRKHS